MVTRISLHSAFMAVCERNFRVYRNRIRLYVRLRRSPLWLRSADLSPLYH
jgi:hypothetical protein